MKETIALVLLVPIVVAVFAAIFLLETKMKKEYKHSCGCKTERINGAIYLNKICKKHKENKMYRWVVSQHKG